MSREEMLDKIEEKFGGDNLRNYYEVFCAESLDAYREGGTLFEIDYVAHLMSILGFTVSYALMKYIDKKLCEDSSILELTDDDYDRIMEVCADYMEGKE